MHIRRLAAVLPLAAATAFLALSFPASAAELVFGKHAGHWEVRSGLAAFDTGPFTPQVESGVVVNGEILAPSPGFLSAIGAPRPYLGADIATNGETEVLYGGLNWQAHLDRFYLGMSAGASLNDGATISGGGETKNLGSNVLFHLQASAGVDVTDALSAEVYLNHFSNAGLGDSNDGLESAGLRIGYRF